MRSLWFTALLFTALCCETTAWGECSQFLADEASPPLQVSAQDFKCDAQLPDGTCIIDKSRKFIGTGGQGVYIEVPGNLQMAANTTGTKVVLTSDTDLAFVAKGWVHVGVGVTLVGRTVEFVGSSVKVTDAAVMCSKTAMKVTATSGELSVINHANLIATIDFMTLAGPKITLDWGGSVQSVRKGVIMGQQTGLTCESVSVIGKGTLLQSGSEGITMICAGGHISVSDSAVITAHGTQPEDGVAVTANDIHFVSNDTAVNTAFLVMVANTTSELAVPLPGLMTKGKVPVLCSLTVTLAAYGSLKLGYPGGSWLLQRLSIVSGKISVTPGLIIRTNGSSCDNRRGSSADPCQTLLPFADFQNYLSQGIQGLALLAEAIQADTSSGNVSFDFAMAATTKLRVEDTSRLIAGSMLLCAGSLAHLGASVVVDASGHGCGPGQGDGHGESRMSSVGCGGGGGSHIGTGGSGAKYDAVSYNACAQPGDPYDAYNEENNMTIPTQGASGGACALTPCEKDDASLLRPAHGGGLVWLSAPTFQFGPSVEVRAQGTPGTTMKSWSGAQMLSGGGAGGAIFLYTSELNAAASHPSLLSVQGGASQCTTDKMSGAGGGGFVGLSFTGKTLRRDALDGITVKYGGGGIDQNCQGLISKPGEAQVSGHNGQAASLRPCQPGLHGMFCLPCKVGTWNDNGLMECYPCVNKPREGAEYVGEGWTNSSCDYRCKPGLPNVRSNPECLDPVNYAVRFFGGVAGCMAILACLLAVMAFLLFRRATASKRILGHPRRDIEGASFFAAPIESVVSCCGLRCWRRRRRRQHQRARTHTTLSWQLSGEAPPGFRNEWLPYHVCRLFLSGSNQQGRPWGVDAKVPPCLAPLVNPGPWMDFASQVNQMCRVPLWEGLLSDALCVLCPPLAVLFQQMVGARRCASVRHLAESFSASQCERPIWRLTSTGFDNGTSESVAEGTHTSGPVDLSQLKMTFSSDPASTLAYFDFFDFRRSCYDWAPADLRHEVRVLPAHGDGSIMEPFSLRVEDPVVQDISQGDAVATSYLITAFNRYARMLTPEEVNRNDGGVSRLRERVHHYAERCHMAEFVEVLVLPEYPHSGLPAEDYRASVRTQATDPTNAQSFSDLVARQSMEDGRRPHGSRAQAAERGRSWYSPCNRRRSRTSQASAEVTPAERAQPLSGGARPEGDAAEDRPNLKLCLVFGDIAAINRALSMQEEAPGDHSPPHPSSFEAHIEESMAAIRGRYERRMSDASSQEATTGRSTMTSREPGCRALSSPMERADLSKLIAAGLAVAEAQPPPPRKALGALLPCCMRLVPSSLLVFLVAALFADLMLCVLQFYTQLKTSTTVCLAWILAPPLIQPMTVIAGPAFVFSEWPRVGRLYALMQLVSMGGCLFTTILLLLIAGTDSWTYDLANLAAVTLVKGGLHVSACSHALNLEAAFDADFFNLPSNPFLNSRHYTDQLNHTQSGADEPRSAEDGAGLPQDGAFRSGLGMGGTSRYDTWNNTHGGHPMQAQASHARSLESSSSSFVATPF